MPPRCTARFYGSLPNETHVSNRVLGPGWGAGGGAVRSKGMVLGTLFLHRDSVLRRRLRGERAPPRRPEDGFPARTLLFLPPPLLCTLWCVCWRHGLAVPMPPEGGWRQVSEAEGRQLGALAMGGWLLFALLLWSEGCLTATAQPEGPGTGGGQSNADKKLK